MTWTLTASMAAINKAGTHANSTIIASGAALLQYCTDAEGFVCAQCHNDFVANYSSLSTQIKGALSSAVSSLIATDIVYYDVTGYLVREADMIMNANSERYSQALKTLSLKQNQTIN